MSLNVKNNIFKILLTVLFLFVFLVACERDEVVSLPVGACDPSNASYSKQITVYISAYGCTTCHGPGATPCLVGYSNIKAAAVAGMLTVANLTSHGMISYFGGDTCAPKLFEGWAKMGAPNN